MIFVAKFENTQTHKQNHHENGIKDTTERVGDHQCSVCFKTFQRQYKLNIHMKHSHGSKKDRHKSGTCLLCGKFSTSVTRHVSQVHNKERKHKCNICGKTFHEQQHLRSHNEENHLEEKTLKCNKCEKTFGGPYALKEHEKFVHKEKIHKCDQCEKAFQRRGHLNAHIKTIHNKMFDFNCNQWL